MSKEVSPDQRVYTHLICSVALVACGAASCKKGDPAPQPVRGATSSAEPTTARGAPGAGDRSGTSIPNARPLLAGAPTTLRATCSGAARYVGPFAFTKSPEKLEIRADVKGTSAAQICRGTAHFVDSQGGRPAVASLPCVEGGKVTTVTISHEHSPHNGGSDVTPVYWELKNDEARPEGCETIDVTLTLR